MKINFPLFFSKFVRKRNAAFDGDPEGDYVEAEDINELQESIERLEQVIGIEDLTDTISSQLNSEYQMGSNDFGPPLFINYRSSSINTYDTLSERISSFSYIPHLALKKETSNSSTEFFKQVISSGVKLYGIIDPPYNQIATIKAEIDWFKENNFNGILLSDFGYQTGFTRGMQNEILDYIHLKNMNAIVTGNIDELLFNKPHGNNPNQIELSIEKNDIYLTENVFIQYGVKSTPEMIEERVFDLNKAQKDLGIKVFVEDHMDMDSDKLHNFLHGKLLSTLYNLDGYSISPTSGYSLNEKVEKFTSGIDLGKWKTDEPIFVSNDKIISREIEKGTIVYDRTLNKVFLKGVSLSSDIFTWHEDSIPGSAINFDSARYGSDGVEQIVSSINENDHFIHFSKIEGFESGIDPEELRQDVIKAINTSPAAKEVNPPDGNTEAGNKYIHGSVIDHISAESIKSGVLNIDRIKANVIDAINAYVGTATIDKAFIGELDASHITAKVVDAINLYAENAGINRAVINSAVIGNLSAEHIKASVIDAINANIENAFIDGGIIDKGTIGSAQIADGSITSAKIVDLVANKITSGIINTGQVTIQGDSGHLRISGNKMQVFDDQDVPIERVSIGDVNSDGTIFGLRVRGADGETVLYDEKGVYSEGITDGAITNPKISDGAVENRHIVANTITGDKVVAESITGREIAAETINANHIQAQSITGKEMAAGTITAESGVLGEAAIVRANIQDGAIGSAEIGEAVIDDAHINSLNADKINAGRVKAKFLEIGPDTDFGKGYSPDDLREEMENRIPYRVEIVSSNGTTFKNGKINTTLTAKVYKGPEDITDLIEASRFVWRKVGSDGGEDTSWSTTNSGQKEVVITNSDVFNRATFLCEIKE